MKEKMRQAFSSLHPSRDILAEVLKQADAQKARRSPSLCRLCRSVVVAVLVTATLTVTVFAADYVINQRDIFFFDTLEALTKFQTAQNGNGAAAVSVADAGKSLLVIAVSDRAEIVGRRLELRIAHSVADEHEYIFGGVLLG